jgi:hypothetical protein
MMTASFQNWPKFFQQSFKYSPILLLSPNKPFLLKPHHSALTPSSYLELADLCFPLQSDDGTLLPDSALYKWSALFLEAAEKAGRIINSAKYYKEQMESAGFVDVVETIYKWPTNKWPKDKKYKELGKLYSISSLLLKPFFLCGIVDGF